MVIHMMFLHLDTANITDSALQLYLVAQLK